MSVNVVRETLRITRAKAESAVAFRRPGSVYDDARGLFSFDTNVADGSVWVLVHDNTTALAIVDQTSQPLETISLEIVEELPTRVLLDARIATLGLIVPPGLDPLDPGVSP